MYLRIEKMGAAIKNNTLMVVWSQLLLNFALRCSVTKKYQKYF
jgi:hypothetical protein